MDSMEHSATRKVSLLAENPPLSSSGPGRRVLSPKTGVRLPVGVFFSAALVCFVGFQPIMREKAFSGKFVRRSREEAVAPDGSSHALPLPD
jgi:hypothetical protein